MLFATVIVPSVELNETGSGEVHQVRRIFRILEDSYWFSFRNGRAKGVMAVRRGCTWPTTANEGVLLQWILLVICVLTQYSGQKKIIDLTVIVMSVFKRTLPLLLLLSFIYIHILSFLLGFFRFSFPSPVSPKKGKRTKMFCSINEWNEFSFFRSRSVNDRLVASISITIIFWLKIWSRDSVRIL